MSIDLSNPLLFERDVFEHDAPEPETTNTTDEAPSPCGEGAQPHQPTHQEEPLPPLGGTLDVLDELLRHRRRILRRIERSEDLVLIARSMLICILVTMSVVGMGLGFFRGGIQILYAAIKVPVVVVLTVSICAPCFTAIKRAMDQPHDIARDFALVLSTMALGSMVIAALSPLLVMVIFYKLPYHQLFLFVALLATIGGAMGYLFFFEGIKRTITRGHRLICITVLFVMAMVGAQMSWVLRPYLVRPASTEVPFVRNIEGGLINAILQSSQSARGIYRVKRDLNSKARRRYLRRTR